jgi:D-xylose transport system substrate-binding protein
MPGGQSRGALQAMVEFLRNGTQPEPVVLLTPIAITKDNLDVVVDAGWISKDELCAGVPAGSVAACD